MGYTVSWDPKGFTDTTYKKVIDLIKKTISSDTKFFFDDNHFVIGEDDDCACFLKSLDQIPFVKTNRAPYTLDVFIALILMLEFRAIHSFDHSDSVSDNSLIFTALQKINNVYHLNCYSNVIESFGKGS